MAICKAYLSFLHVLCHEKFLIFNLIQFPGVIKQCAQRKSVSAGCKPVPPCLPLDGIRPVRVAYKTSLTTKNYELEAPYVNGRECGAFLTTRRFLHLKHRDRRMTSRKFRRFPGNKLKNPRQFQ